MDEIIQSIYIQTGAVGLFVGFLIYVVVILYRELRQKNEAFNALLEKYHTSVLEQTRSYMELAAAFNADREGDDVEILKQIVNMLENKEKK